MFISDKLIKNLELIITRLELIKKPSNCSLAAKNLNCHPTLIIETLDGAILSISSAIQEEVFEWFITQSLIGLGLDSTLQIRKAKKPLQRAKMLEAYTIQDGVRIYVCDFVRLIIFYYYGRNGTIR